MTVTLFNPKASALIQKHHPYTGNLNSETPGDDQKRILYVVRRARQKGKPAVYSLVAQARHELQSILVSVSLV